MTQKRRFKKEYAKELLQVAIEDLETARILQKGNVSRRENILFHVQQSVEKGLKAAICAREIDVPLVHDIPELMRELDDYETIPHYDQLYDLTQFATIRRYEEGIAVISDDEVADSIAAAHELLAWVENSLKKQGL